jgi:plastocyanin
MTVAVRFAVVLVGLFAGAAGAATIEIDVRDFRFSPNDVTINVGDTVRWVNRGGFHDVKADDNSFSRAPANAPWTFERTFNAAATILYHCSVHSAPGVPINSGMNGRIVVNPAAPTFSINQGIAGAWFNPATSGQGFLIDVEPASRFMFVAWFTYVPATSAAAKVGVPEHRWLSAQGNYTGGSAPLTVFQTSGGRFNSSQATTTVPVGTMTLTFTSCTAGTVQFNLDEGLSGSIPIQRVIPGTELLCQTLSTSAADVDGNEDAPTDPYDPYGQ